MPAPKALAAWLQRQWWQPQPSLAARCLQPLSWLYGGLLRRQRRRARVAQPSPVPVVVVGNLVVGGAGKTPVVIALVQGLQALGWQPGVVSRGYGRQDDALRPVQVQDPAQLVGDEPLLIHRRTGVPVWVGRQRAEAAQALCAAHPQVDVIVSDDGLQHRALARAAELLLFDERGIGNGLLLPAGPLREPLPHTVQPWQRVLASGARPAPLQPALPLQRRLGQAWPLQAWWAGDASACLPLASLRGRRLLALAGIATPERFFTMLREQGLDIEPCPQADHADYSTLPWPAATQEVVVTEKDAVKLPPQAVGAARVWVLGLDLDLPQAWVQDLAQLLAATPRPRPEAGLQA